MLKKAKDALLFVIIAAIILCISLVALFLPDRTFSENENKVLSQFPVLSFQTLVDGTFAMNYETYVADQFWLRDEWIAAKSVAEFALLKTENNGIAYGADGYMFSKYTTLNEARFQTNLSAVAAFADALDCELSVLVVPSAYTVLLDKLPAGMPGVDEEANLAVVESTLGATVNYVDALDPLRTHSGEYIYFRTDHHWTAYGAYIAYCEYAKSAGLTPIAYDTLTPAAVEGFLGTSYSKCKAFNVQPDTITYFPALDCVSLVSNNVKHSSLYNLDQFALRDKYAAFLYGNSSLIEIETKYSDAKRDSILIVRDSYADSLVPYLTAHYNKIILVDPRYYVLPFSALAAEAYTDALIVMGFENLAGEQSVVKLGL